ncbi:MAG: TonB C-terminal domain-containing protein, partial [Bacteriovoracaceae bacterium]|nr:TonB C-terminal domain-containing protein [Bacteriovoracaceae bacterium]
QKERNIQKRKDLSKQVAKGLKSGERTKRGLSRSSDFLEDVPLGDFTKLNTQEFRFYGFYHRIREKLEQFWGANLQQEMERIYSSGRSIASGKNFLTSLVIKMNAKGEIIKIQLNSTSGIQELDEIAISSFNEAGPFPNPPKKMLNDGVATIKWGFAVTSN